MHTNLKKTKHFVVMARRMGAQEPLLVTSDRVDAVSFAAGYIDALGLLRPDDPEEICVYCFVDGLPEPTWTAETSTLLAAWANRPAD